MNLASRPLFANISTRVTILTTVQLQLAILNNVIVHNFYNSQTIKGPLFKCTQIIRLMTYNDYYACSIQLLISLNIPQRANNKILYNCLSVLAELARLLLSSSVSVSDTSDFMD